LIVKFDCVYKKIISVQADTRKKGAAIMGSGYGMMEGWFGGGVFMLLFGAVIIVVGFFLIRMLMDNSKTAGRMTENTELAILKERYVRGDISHKEFDKMKMTLL
jgi:uncharacterized membrane protein